MPTFRRTIFARHQAYRGTDLARVRKAADVIDIRPEGQRDHRADPGHTLQPLHHGLRLPVRHTATIAARDLHIQLLTDPLQWRHGGGQVRRQDQRGQTRRHPVTAATGQSIARLAQ